MPSGRDAGVDRAPARPVWFDAFVVGILAFAVFAVTAQYHDPLNNDPHATAIAAWQLGHHGNATLTAFQGKMPWLYTVDGREVTNRLPGAIFWAAPFYALLGPNSYPPIYPSAIAAVVASALAIAFTFSLCCRLVSRRAAAVAAALLAFATGTWTVSAHELWTHGPAQAAVLLTLMFVVRNQWLLAGLPAGFAILIRPHLGVVALVFCIGAVMHTKQRKPLLIGVGAAAGAAMLLAYNNALWGGLSIFGGYDQPVVASDHKIVALITGFVGDFVSPERGLLVMTPALVMLLPGGPRRVANRSGVGALVDSGRIRVSGAPALGNPLHWRRRFLLLPHHARDTKSVRAAAHADVARVDVKDANSPCDVRGACDRKRGAARLRRGHQLGAWWRIQQAVADVSPYRSGAPHRARTDQLVGRSLSGRDCDGDSHDVAATRAGRH